MKTCSVCLIEKPLVDFWADRRRTSGLMARCKDCNRAQASAYRSSKPSYHKESYAKTKAQTRERHLVRKYGVNLAAYDRMLADQDGKCAICRAPEEVQFKGVFHVDHCHSTGAVRGLLCRGCNHMLGVVGDDPAILQRAIAYLGVPQVAAEIIAAYMETQG